VDSANPRDANLPAGIRVLCLDEIRRPEATPLLSHARNQSAECARGTAARHETIVVDVRPKTAESLKAAATHQTAAAPTEEPMTPVG
jgi:hypothetical protein